MFAFPSGEHADDFDGMPCWVPYGSADGVPAEQCFSGLLIRNGGSAGLIGDAEQAPRYRWPEERD